MKSIFGVLNEIMLKGDGSKIFDIPSYRGLYQINNHGEVFSIKERDLEPSGGSVVLTNTDKDRKTLRLNKLLSLSFPINRHFIGRETWKSLPLPKFEHYKISNYSRLKVKRPLKLRTFNGQVILIKNKKPTTFSVLKLYANLFFI